MAATTAPERPMVRAQHRYCRMSATKVRVVLDLIRGLPVDRAEDVLLHTERAAAVTIRKVLDSAVANAEHNEQLDSTTLYVVACYADEGPTLKRWRPRARGRATRIRKRTCHITIVVSTMPQDMLSQVEAERSAAETRSGGRPRGGRSAREARRERVARSRARRGEAAAEDHDHDHDDEEELEDEDLDVTDEVEDDEDVDVEDEELDDDEVEETAEDEDESDQDESDDEEKEAK
jgi:large subunit ribosomal protein L22